MATMTFALSAEDIERVVDGVVERLSSQLQPTDRVRPSTDRKADPIQVSLSEAARLLGYCPMTVYRLVKRGLLRPNRATRRLMFTVKELERFVAECTRPI